MSLFFSVKIARWFPQICVFTKTIDSLLRSMFVLQKWVENFTAVCNCPTEVGCHFFRWFFSNNFLKQLSHSSWPGMVQPTWHLRFSCSTSLVYFGASSLLRRLGRSALSHWKDQNEMYFTYQDFSWCWRALLLDGIGPLIRRTILLQMVHTQDKVQKT